MAILQVLKGSNPGQQFPLDAARTVIGRHPECDIVLDMGSVSREHAQILREDDAFLVEDLHSRNGTFVNGELIQGRRRLVDNDRVKICDLLFTFHQSSPGMTPTSEDSEATSRLATLLEDEENESSTIMSQLDVSSDPSGLRMTVRPEAKLRALIEITENLGKTLELDEILVAILDSLFKIFFHADRGFVILRNEADGTLVPRAVKRRHEGGDETARISRTIVRKAMESKQAILSADAASDERFDLSQSIADFKIRSMMCAPLITSEGEALGVIQIDTQNQRERFRQEDLDVLIAVARQAAIALENSGLHEWALEQRALERDIELAHKVQRGFLPAAPPNLSGYAFFDYYEPARRLGGDYYDYVDLRKGRLAVVVADVSGKGISAALLTAKLSAEVRYCLASEADPAKAVRRLNAAFCNSGWEDRFVTLVLCVIDPSDHSMTIVSAGHMAPLLRRPDGSVVAVGEEQTGIPLGVDEDYPYEKHKMTLNAGESMLLFTDGISEAMNSNDELYSIERLTKEISAAPAGAAELGRYVLDRVRQFVGQRSASDDICLLCLGRDAISLHDPSDDTDWDWTHESHLPSETGAGKKVLDEILAQLEENGWEQSDVFGIHLAVEEALVNAIRHGNESDPSKQVHIDCRLSSGRFWITVADEGPGFDPGAVPDPTEPENLDAPGGRGLLLMRNFMQRVEFNTSGNQVTMEKLRGVPVESETDEPAQ